MRKTQRKSVHNDFKCDKDMLAVLDKFIAVFYLSNKVNFKNYFAK